MSSAQSEIIRVRGVSNAEFLARHAQPGRVGLSGGEALIDRAIQRAQRHLDDAGEWSQWSHAFVFGERRSDGHQWVIESDLQFHRKHVQLGVQENRAAKYADEKLYTRLAVIDFGLSPGQMNELLKEALELVASRTRYSIRELLGTLHAMRHPELRPRENRLAREQSIFCSALVEHLFRKAGVELMPGVHEKNVAPEDLVRSPVPHTLWLLEREAAPGKIQRLAGRVRARVRSRIQAVKARRGSGQ
ncbi:MAG: hypothetical protein HZA89_17705 [Verrucomicrobia bacterium]|nr:hypothetical protein [Verrucomicrobiota bacterium]